MPPPRPPFVLLLAVLLLARTAAGTNVLLRARDDNADVAAACGSIVLPRCRRCEGSLHGRVTGLAGRFSFGGAAISSGAASGSSASNPTSASHSTWRSPKRRSSCTSPSSYFTRWSPLSLQYSATRPLYLRCARPCGQGGISVARYLDRRHTTACRRPTTL